MVRLRRFWIYRVIPADESASFYQIMEKLSLTEGGRAITKTNNDLWPLAKRLKNILQSQKEGARISFQPLFDVGVETTGELTVTYEGLREEEKKYFLAALK